MGAAATVPAEIVYIEDRSYLHSLGARVNVINSCVDAVAIS